MTDPTPAPPSPDVPPWATLTECVCVTGSCSDCGNPVGDEEGATWHFPTLEALREAITQETTDYDDDDPSWRIEGDELLCRRCAHKRTCAEQGHQWEYDPAFTSPYDGRAIPERWWCARYCGAGVVFTDPTLADELGSGDAVEIRRSGGDRS